MSDFTNPEFAAREWDYAIGTVRGYRWWDLRCTMGPDGRLVRGLPRDARPFVTGCCPQLTGMYGWRWKLSEPLQWNKAYCPCGNRPPCDNQGLHVMMPPCGCGFWASWERDAAYAQDAFTTWSVAGVTEVHARLLGAVEGAGRTLIGTRGFRCEKMRVHAVALPERQLEHRNGEALRAGMTEAVAGCLPGAPAYLSEEQLLRDFPATEGYAR